MSNDDGGAAGETDSSQLIDTAYPAAPAHHGPDRLVQAAQAVTRRAARPVTITGERAMQQCSRDSTRFRVKSARSVFVRNNQREIRVRLGRYEL